MIVRLADDDGLLRSKCPVCHRPFTHEQVGIIKRLIFAHLKDVHRVVVEPFWIGP